MRRKRTWTVLALVLAALAAGQSGASAQERAPRKVEREVRVEGPSVQIIRQGEGVGRGEGVGIGVTRSQADTFVFVSTEMSFDGKVVKGAPYSAQAVTETTQVLADGNRIVRKNTADVYRDGEGRTRRDQKLSVLGPFASAGDPPQTTVINDPVAGVTYMLDPRTRTARKMGISMRFDYKIPEGAEPGRAANGAPPPPPGVTARRRESSGYVFTAPAPGPMPPPELGVPPGGDVVFYSNSDSSEDSKNVKNEKLGTETVEGVQAEGSRTTITIPAGEIGNERPIEIVSERWYSRELQTVVMMRHSDPRFGESVYRLTNINRTEPAHTLFEVPADYAVKEGPMFMRSRGPKPGGANN